MNRAMLRDMLRGWLRAWKRFASIAMISLLGVAVLTGIYAGCRDTFLAADRFYDAQGLMDIQVLSTLGLDDGDVEALRAVEGVRTVQPERSQNVTVRVGGSQKRATIGELGAEGLNMPRLESGRMPSAAGEVAVTDKFIKDSGLGIGDAIVATPDDADDDADAEDSADAADAADDADGVGSTPRFPTDLVIVGVVLDPADLSNPYGYAGKNFRNNAASDYAFFASSDGVTGATYTSISLTVDGAAALDTFSDRYDATVKAVADRIRDTVQTDRQEARRQTLVDAAQRRLDDAKADAYAQLDDAAAQLDASQTELDANRRTLADSRAQLESRQAELRDGERQIASGRTQIRDGRDRIADGRRQLDAAREQLNAGKAQLADARAQLDAGRAQLAQARARIEEQLAQLAQATQTTQAAQDDSAADALRAQLDAIAQQETALDAQDAQLTAKEQETQTAERQLDAQQAALDEQSAELERRSAELESQAARLADGRHQIEDGLRQVADGETQLAEGQGKLDEARAELASRRTDADAEFARRQQQIADIAQARWYVQTRSSIGGFNALDSDLSSIESIGRAFPVVFLLVAALMSLTAMTRMVEEDRGLIGTYLGLGYGGAAVAQRYLLFALLACLIGGGLGLLVGFLGIPAFLRLVIDEMYMVPDVRLEYDWGMGSFGVALFVAGVLGATLAACAGEMRQTPAALMRPRAPRAGARILLERVRPVWRRLSFLNKVTVRNIFRFKSRLIMTVLGVAGCTALIVCGLAINDTVATLGPRQYEDLYRYDALVVSGDDTADAMFRRLADDGRATETLRVRIESGEITNDAGASGAIQLVVVPDADAGRLGDMVTLARAEGDRGTVSLGDDAVGADGVIAEQSAVNALGIRDGQTVTVADGQGRRAQTTVTAVTRNLIGSNVYMRESLYRSLLGGAPGGTSDAASSAVTPNAAFATLSGDADARIAYVAALEEDPDVLRAMSCDDMERNFSFDLMGAVVALITLLAGLLAVVVLFTLASTNVSERVREMATLKVLGFFDREVHLYVNKEMTALTLMGIAAGLPLGRVVGGLLTAAIDMSGLYFEVEVRPSSYAIAAAATLAFSMLVQLLANPALDRIDPVSSLKSVE
ncbi:ABC transporter permease [Bifidobacterium sp. DSM 109958]|uniref:ABC transporter permease n=1 Tax=Bifidobacterium moraviense TaxID=2675323 RepID=A0A7Y0F2F1_9BIFI|nr:FtsX-like permease family protein [Bifidobacterium sp. DSM 109958]NMN00811.1 ABC transporter permease [Bifidobacterium sp. DSM 109958]